MVGTTEVIDIAGDLYTTKKNANTNNGRKTMRYLDKLGIRSIDKFKEIYGVNDEDVLLIEKYLKYGYDEKNLNIDDESEKDKLIEILTNGLNFYKNEVEIIERLNKLKNSPTSVRDYIVIKKYNSISELINKIQNAKLVHSYEPIDDDKMHEILVYVAWYLLHSKNKRPESLDTFITAIDNKTISIQDIVDGIKELKTVNESDKISKFIVPFDVMGKEITSYTEAVRKMKSTMKNTTNSTKSTNSTNNTKKNTTVKGGVRKEKQMNSFSNFLHLHRYLNQ